MINFILGLLVFPTLIGFVFTLQLIRNEYDKAEMLDYLKLIVSPLIGLLCVWEVMKPKKAPMDSSNRINHIILLWLACTRYIKVRKSITSTTKTFTEALFEPETFITTCPWLRNDVWFNMEQINIIDDRED